MSIDVFKTLIDFIENNSIDANPFLQSDYRGGSIPLHWVARAGNQEVAYMVMDLGLRSGMNPATFMGPDRFGSYPFQPEQCYHSVLRLDLETDKSFSTRMFHFCLFLHAQSFRVY